MMVRRLLKSCARPPVSWPIDSIFCALYRRSLTIFLSVRVAHLHDQLLSFTPAVLHHRDRCGAMCNLALACHEAHFLLQTREFLPQANWRMPFRNWPRSSLCSRSSKTNRNMFQFSGRLRKSLSAALAVSMRPLGVMIAMPWMELANAPRKTLVAAADRHFR